MRRAVYVSVSLLDLLAEELSTAGIAGRESGGGERLQEESHNGRAAAEE